MSENGLFVVVVFSGKIQHFHQWLILECRKDRNEYKMWALEGIFRNCGSWSPRKMITSTILGLYNVLQFTKGLSCSSLYVTLVSALRKDSGSMISTLQVRKLRLPEVDFPNSQWNCPRGLGMASRTSHWRLQPCEGIWGVVRPGWRCKVIPQIAILGRLAVLHKLAASPGSDTLLTSLSRFNLAPVLGFPGMEMAPQLLDAEEQVEHLATNQL